FRCSAVEQLVCLSICRTDRKARRSNQRIRSQMSRGSASRQKRSSRTGSQGYLIGKSFLSDQIVGEARARKRYSPCEGAQRGIPRFAKGRLMLRGEDCSLLLFAYTHAAEGRKKPPELTVS